MARVRTVPKPPPRLQGAAVRLHFGHLDKITIDGVDYRCVHTDDNGHIFQAAHDEHVHKPVSHPEIAIISDSAEYRHDRNWYALGEARARLRADVPMLNHLTKNEREKILHRYDYATEFMRLETTDPNVTRGNDSIDAAIGRITETLKGRAHAAADQGRRKRAGRPKITFAPPGRKGLLVWVNRLTEGGGNPLALRDRYGKCGNRTERLLPEEYELVEQFADMYLARHKPSIRNLHIDMQIEVNKRNTDRVAKGLPLLTVPSYDRLREEISEFPEFEVIACREGIEKAMKRFRPVGEGIPDVYRPFQHTEMDHWSVQLHTWCKKSHLWEQLTDEEKAAVKKARYTLGMVVCRRTRCIAALRLTPTATAQSALELLEMAVSEKHDYATGVEAATPWDIQGTMAWMYADGGFANHVFKTALASLGIDFEIPPNGLAHMRGIIERSFRLMHEKVVARFDGRTFKNIVEKGDYDSEARTGTFVDELAMALVRFAVDVHHNTPHPSLDHETPRQCWIRLTKEYGVDPPPDWHKRRHVFGLDITPTLGPAGLRFLGIQYRSERLHEHFKQHGVIEMEGRVDERNLGAISVRIGKSWLTVYGPPEFERMHADTWIAAEADLRRRGYRTAEVTAPIRLKAIDDINRKAAEARRRVGIDDERTTAQKLLIAERQMQIGASFPEEARDAHRGPEGLYEDALTVGQRATSASPDQPSPTPQAPGQSPGAADDAPSPSTPRRNPPSERRWTHED